jgi:5-methylcytosine-specific restriction endonuclease McrA
MLPEFDDFAAQMQADPDTAGLLEAALATLPYDRFLESPYWDLVRRELRAHRCRCERCGERDGVHAHHRSYEHRGSEWRHLEDLELLCGVCHAMNHGTPTTPASLAIEGKVLPEEYLTLRLR